MLLNLLLKFDQSPEPWKSCFILVHPYLRGRWFVSLFNIDIARIPLIKIEFKGIFITSKRKKGTGIICPPLLHFLSWGSPPGHIAAQQLNCLFRVSKHRGVLIPSSRIEGHALSWKVILHFPSTRLGRLKLPFTQPCPLHRKREKVGWDTRGIKSCCIKYKESIVMLVLMMIRRERKQWR